ncbi:hypothetical protein BYT27DRAFT_6926094 [Phlegmacium glaucopus]|nr:hypothetical protein BYT27DRAFT_6926094 [Phlegmacium glaucopus]
MNASCTGDAKAPALVELCGLKKLTLYSPGRAILQLLPDWLRSLSGTLQELHLKGNCGSVTPGVLRFFIPHIQDNLHALTLGLSYSLTDEDVFTCLGNLPNLNRIQLRYYWQMKHPSRMPKLLNLRSFTVTHSYVQSRNEVNELCKWIRRAIAGSSIEELRVIGDNVSDLPISGIHLCFSGLFDHILKKQFSTIRVLDLGSAFVGVDHLRSLLIACIRLEEVKLQVGQNALNVFAVHCSGLVRLHSASFQVRNVKHSFRVEEALINDIMRNGPASLRRLSVNGTMWQSSWIVDTDHHAELIIKPAGDLIPPWARC